MSNWMASGNIKTNTFSYMFTGAKFMLQQSEKSDEGQLYSLISCFTYCAFTLEAYFNHLGKLRDNNWDDIERKYPKLKKYTKFCDELGLSIDLNRRPYVSIKNVFSFRDSIAHGKTTNEKISVERKNSSLLDLPATEWKEFVSLENAKECLNDVEEIILELHLKSGYKNNPFSSSGSEIWCISKT